MKILHTALFFLWCVYINRNAVGYGQHTRSQILGRKAIHCALCVRPLWCNWEVINRFEPWCQFTFIFLHFIFWSKAGSPFNWNLNWRSAVDDFSLQWHRIDHPTPPPSSIPTLFFQARVYLWMQLSHVVLNIGPAVMPLAHPNNGRCPQKKLRA